VGVFPFFLTFNTSIVEIGAEFQPACGVSDEIPFDDQRCGIRGLTAPFPLLILKEASDCLLLAEIQNGSNTESSLKPRRAATSGYRWHNRQKFFRARDVGQLELTAGFRAINHHFRMRAAIK
jgi:hypothetical protein